MKNNNCFLTFFEYFLGWKLGWTFGLNKCMIYGEGIKLVGGVCDHMIIGFEVEC